MRDVTDKSIKTAALNFVSLLHLSDNDTTRRIADKVLYIQSLYHRAYNSKEFEKSLKYKKEEAIEAGSNCITKIFMICTAYQIVFGRSNTGE